MPGDLRQIVESVLLAYATLFPIVNPVGGAPVFMAMAADCTPELRATLATRIAVNAFVLMVASVFVGTYVLDFFGLSLPITVGPGTITVAITIGANHPTTMRALVDHSIGQIAGVFLVAATIFVCYRYADRLLTRLGAAGTSVVVRLSAFILFCIGVQIAWNGTRGLLASVGLIYGR